MSDPNEQAPHDAASTETSAEHTEPAAPTHAFSAAMSTPTSKPATPQTAPGHKPVEEWARLKNTDDHWFAGARARFGWATGRELTEEKYDAAIEAAKKVESR